MNFNLLVGLLYTCYELGMNVGDGKRENSQNTKEEVYFYKYAQYFQREKQ